MRTLRKSVQTKCSILNGKDNPVELTISRQRIVDLKDKYGNLVERATALRTESDAIEQSLPNCSVEAQYNACLAVSDLNTFDLLRAQGDTDVAMLALALEGCPEDMSPEWFTAGVARILTMLGTGSVPFSAEVFFAAIVKGVESDVALMEMVLEQAEREMSIVRTGVRG